MKAGVYGAIKGEFRDKTYEQRIDELEEEIEKLKLEKYRSKI
ncbi:MAG TPA: hypothetical protein VE818_03710 [Nitrososphaeraceae archaeon]|jgi:hypothetical protein|nr:hypothetical protein [Nitrososphaeraceae archaeon]